MSNEIVNKEIELLKQSVQELKERIHKLETWKDQVGLVTERSGPAYIEKERLRKVLSGLKGKREVGNL